jgi:hypothetical protein
VPQARTAWSEFVVDQGVVTEIDYYGMKVALKPAFEGVEAPVDRPH